METVLCFQSHRNTVSGVCCSVMMSETMSGWNIYSWFIVLMRSAHLVRRFQFFHSFSFFKNSRFFFFRKYLSISEGGQREREFFSFFFFQKVLGSDSKERSIVGWTGVTTIYSQWNSFQIDPSGLAMLKVASKSNLTSFLSPPASWRRAS